MISIAVLATSPFQRRNIEEYQDDLQSAATKIGVQRQSRHKLNLHRAWIVIHLGTGDPLLRQNFLFYPVRHPRAGDGLGHCPPPG